MSLGVSDVPDDRQQTFIEYVEGETGIQRLYLGLILAIYTLVTILFLLYSAYSWATRCMSKFKRRNNLNEIRFSFDRVNQYIDVEDMWTANFDEFCNPKPIPDKKSSSGKSTMKNKTATNDEIV